MEDAREYSVRLESDDVYAMALIGKKQVHGLGYDDDAGGWVQFESVAMEYSDEAANKFEATIEEWVKSTYGGKLERGDLVMIGAADVAEKSSEATGEGEKEVPWEVEQGLEPEYDCPDCDYYETGLSSGPHAFLDHLQEDHGYSQSEAFDILN
jgi:hypothetical protein